MSNLFKHLQIGAVALALTGSTASLLVPTPAAAWGWHHPGWGWHRAWHPGWGWRPGYGWAAPGYVVRVAPPIVVAPPPVVYARPPVVAGPVWIRPHWNGPYWVRGHWG